MSTGRSNPKICNNGCIFYHIEGNKKYCKVATAGNDMKYTNYYNGEIPTHGLLFLESVGCASFESAEENQLFAEDYTAKVHHAQHLEYLNNGADQRIADVIAEMKKERANAQKEITHQFLDQDAYREGIIKTCNKAISLLRGEQK